MAVKTFTADTDKTVSVTGKTYTINTGDIPAGITLYINEVKVNANQTVTITEDMFFTWEKAAETSTITVDYTNANSATFNGNAITTGQVITVSGTDNNLSFTGATSIPSIQITGDGINKFAVNSVEFSSDSLPYTFQPLGGVTNSIFVQGTASGTKNLTINGTNISAMTINGTKQTLPYTADITDNINISVAGEVYQVDIKSPGGAVISENGVVISDGTSNIHKIIDISEDTYFTIDGTHTLTVDGENIKDISVNGVTVDFDSLPVSVKNKNMNADVNISGFQPSEVHLVGQYIKSAIVDGVSIPISESGDVELELTTVEENHFININGAQPRSYGLTWNDNSSTIIEMDGDKMTSGTTTYIEKDVYIDAVPTKIPIHIESASNANVQVNGRDYNSNDFTVEINSATEIDVTTETCNVTIDYGDNSYTFSLPQTTIFITAPHRDGWIFDGWSSNNCGINNPKSVQTSIDLNGKNNVNLVAHYQRYLTWNKPNEWN